MAATLTGHRAVRILDGDLGTWTGPLETGTGRRSDEGDFTPAPGALPLLTADTAAAWAREGLLLDARAGERYRGEVEPIDAVAGHIPGSVSAPTDGNLDEHGRFLPPATLRERFTALGAESDEVAVYCGSGVSAAQQAIALELAGFVPALYAGSWSEWSRDPARPVATGPLPG
ncbi:thiosulfate sulfurtransferase [Streptomyces clavuligerus]|nr:thiosulfate sulfurtransferase [Streptomyces clavuligerus]